jgi:hypothetical protein
MFVRERAFDQKTVPIGGTNTLLTAVVSAYQKKIDLVQKDTCYRPECCISRGLLASRSMYFVVNVHTICFHTKMPEFGCF